MKKIFFVFFILVILFISTIYIYPQVPKVIIYKLQFLNKLGETVNVTPTSHVVSSVPKKQGKTYEYDGISITTDWPVKEVRDEKYSKFIIFNNGGLIVMNSSDWNVNLYDNIKQVLLEKYKLVDVNTYLSNSDVRSNHDVYKKMLNVTKKDINIKKTMEKLSLNIALVALKRVTLLDTKEILMYDINDTTFYQYSPLGNESTYVIDFFDSFDNQRSISIKKDNITQQEIESIVKTIEINNQVFQP